MYSVVKDLTKNWLRKSSAYFFDRWLFDQQIPVQALPKTLFHYKPTVFGEDQFYAPNLKYPELMEDAPQLQSMYTAQVLPRPYHYTIQNAILSGCEILDPARPDQQIMETFPESTRIQDGIDFPTLIKNNYRMRKAAKSISPEYDEGVLLSGYWWKNYYHFLIDCCLRCNLLKEKGIINENTKVFIHQSPSKWQSEYLRIIGIKDHQIVNTEDKTVQVKKLIVGSPCRNRFLVSKTAVDCLKDTLGLSERKPELKLYLSRRDDSTRKVLNDDEVSAALKQYGYQTVITSKLSIEEQINLFSRAESIVAPHGAAISNIIYSGSINLIEMFPEDDWKLGFFVVLANVLNINYAPLVFKKENDHSDYFVDIDKLTKIIDNLR